MSPTLRPLVLVALLAGACAATAGDKTPAPTQVHGVKLAAICNACGVVSATRTETRKGKSTGVGVVGGAVVGGVVGNQFGHGSGNTAMTVLGAVGGGVAGNEVEKQMKKHTVWLTTVTFKDGRRHTYERTSNPGLKPGDVVTLRDGQPVKRAG